MGKKQTTLKLLLLPFMVLGFVFAFGGKAHAASITVNTDTHPSACTLDEAITNINDQARTNTDCVETGAYGTDDTITIPEGTVLLTGDLPVISQPLTMVGAGMGESIIDGDGQWKAIQSGGFLTASNFTLTSSLDIGMFLNAGGVLNNIEIDGDNWGVSSPSGIAAGIIVSNSNPSDATLNATDVYVHNFDIDVFQIIPFGVSGGSTNDVTASVRNITVSDITNTGSIQAIMVTAGLFDGGASTGGISASVANATVTNLTSLSNIVSGFIVAGSTQSTAVLNASIANSTFTNLDARGTSPFLSGLGNGAVIAEAGSSVNSMTINTTVSNVLIANNNMAHCGVTNINNIYSISGDVINNIISAGGNLSDKTSCATSFNQSTDQNNLTTLKDFLGPLSFNGGYIPTIPLLQGSPAIDSGVTVTGFATDARGVVRPQGSAYDSGSYESPYSKPASLAGTGQNVTTFALFSALLCIAAGGLLVLRRT